MLWYRRIASAGTVDDVDALREDLEAKRPDLPQAAKNLLDKARIKAFANEHHIRTVSVAGGKLVVEPIDVPRDRMTALRRAGGRYLADKRKLSLCRCATSSWKRTTTCSGPSRAFWRN